MFVRVSGPAGPLAGAHVEVFAAGSVAGAGATDGTGLARVIGLAAGTYEVRVDALGYRSRVLEDVRLVAGEARVLEVLLELAPLELEDIRATTDRIQIQRENTDFSTTVDQVAIKLLPLAHEANQIVALTPGARAGHVWGGASFQANNYTLDGLSINHPGMGGNLVEPSINWIERVEVRGLGSGAEFGGFQGGLVNMVTRSGSNTFGGAIRSTYENDALNASNLVGSEIGTEVVTRNALEGEVRGPVVKDRLFYFLSGERIARESRVLNHLDPTRSRYGPMNEERVEQKLFGKLTWRASSLGLFELSAGYLDALTENHGMNGYEGVGAAARYSAPTRFGGIRWHRDLSRWGSVDARINHFSRDERSEAYQGTAVPGIRTFALTPPFTAFGNAPFTLRSSPSSTAGNVTGTFRFPAGEHEHLLRVGGELTRGRFLDQRIRNGGLTWLPPRLPSFDASDASSWSHRNSNFIPSQWGGQVHLNADVLNAALFAQASLAIGSRVVLSPGLRWGGWRGWLTPRSGDRFLAVEDHGFDPRIGFAVELDGAGSWIAKAHWGRYHQNMMAQMFDRAAGADVFTNEELWYYRGPSFTDPTTRFTKAQRDSLAALGEFTHESTVMLNETGPVVDYDQPYIDQGLVGVEKQFGSSVKMEALYTRRSNHDMIALVDGNRATNYVVYENVRVYDGGGNPLPYEGRTVWLDELYVPTHAIIDNLKYCAVNGDRCGELGMMPPGFEFADTLSLAWNPDYVLTNAPGAERRFDQVQFSIEVARPLWGGSFSAVFTHLRGNLDNVSGYDDPAEYGAGPYVRVNESVNSYGILPNFAEREAKASVWGTLPWKLRAGLVWKFASGDHFSPRFRISGMGFYRYKANDGVIVTTPRGSHGSGDEVDWRMLASLEGHHTFVGPRGAPNLPRQASFDVRLDRAFEWGRYDLTAALHLFNIFGQDTETKVNDMVNHGRNYWYFLDQPTGAPGARIPENQYFRAVLERAPPRTVRLGMDVQF